MAEVDPNSDEVPERSRLEDIKYYTSLFLGSTAIISVFAFLFLIPFILDPAISTMVHSFVEDPVHCKVSGNTEMKSYVNVQVTSHELLYGKTNCSWASCREGCTIEIFRCHQIRVTYTPKRNYESNTMVEEIEEIEWANLARTEKKEESNHQTY